MVLGEEKEEVALHREVALDENAETGKSAVSCMALSRYCWCGRGYTEQFFAPRKIELKLSD